MQFTTFACIFCFGFYSSGFLANISFNLFPLLFSGYPLSFLYHKKVVTQSATIKHLYIAVCGILICIFNYGWLSYHSLTAVLVSYLLITLLNGTALIASSFIFNMSYLLLGYYYTSTETYDITWTMPHCVLTLRLIGLAFDVSDGQRPESELSSSNKKSCLKTKPNLLEVAGFTYFPGSFLVGPQFSFRRYSSFINGEFNKYTGFASAGVKRALAGFAYLAVNVIGGGYLPDEYLYSDEFPADHNIFSRIFLLGIWSRITLYKYISIWLLAESVAICFGLTFNGLDETGKALWDGCANIKLLIFENTRRFQHYIDSFNVQTNHWVAEYIYKRLKFLNNRYYSQFGALFFLALWHGFHSGYYLCFFIEFSVIVCERQVRLNDLFFDILNFYIDFIFQIEPVFARSEKFQKFASTLVGQVTIWILLKVYTVIGMGFCLTPIALLSFHRWWKVYQSVWFYGVFLWYGWPLYKPALKTVLGSSKKSEQKKQ